MKITVPVAPGDLIDRLTILHLKAEKVPGQTMLANVKHELETLQAVADDQLPISPELKSLWAELSEINRTLWQIEDDIRLCEAKGDFGETFVSLARAVYQTNDKRAAIKKQMNHLLGSAIVEEKFYTGDSKE